MRVLIRRRLRLASAGVALVAVALAVAACQEVPSTLVSSKPYELEPIEGSDISLVRMNDETAAKIGVTTVEVSEDGARTVVPHAALIYSPQAEPFVYTKPEPETYLREPVEVSHVDDDLVVLSEGPAPGTTVVTVGAAELLATEFEILNQHP